MSITAVSASSKPSEDRGSPGGSSEGAVLLGRLDFGNVYATGHVEGGGRACVFSFANPGPDDLILMDLIIVQISPSDGALACLSDDAASLPLSKVSRIESSRAESRTEENPVVQRLSGAFCVLDGPTLPYTAAPGEIVDVTVGFFPEVAQQYVARLLLIPSPTHPRQQAVIVGRGVDPPTSSPPGSYFRIASETPVSAYEYSRALIGTDIVNTTGAVPASVYSKQWPGSVAPSGTVVHPSFRHYPHSTMHRNFLTDPRGAGTDVRPMFPANSNVETSIGVSIPSRPPLSSARPSLENIREERFVPMTSPNPTDNNRSIGGAARSISSGDSLPQSSQDFDYRQIASLMMRVERLEGMLSSGKESLLKSKTRSGPRISREAVNDNYDFTSDEPPTPLPYKDIFAEDATPMTEDVSKIKNRRIVNVGLSMGVDAISLNDLGDDSVTVHQSPKIHSDWLRHDPDKRVIAANNMFSPYIPTGRTPALKNLDFHNYNGASPDVDDMNSRRRGRGAVPSHVFDAKGPPRTPVSRLLRPVHPDYNSPFWNMKTPIPPDTPFEKGSSSNNDDQLCVTPSSSPPRRYINPLPLESTASSSPRQPVLLLNRNRTMSMRVKDSDSFSPNLSALLGSLSPPNPQQKPLPPLARHNFQNHLMY